MKSEGYSRINIVKPKSVMIDPKARANEAPVSTQLKQTPSSKRIYTPINRGQSVLVLHGPPPPLEIQKLNTSRHYMLTILKQLNQVVKENDATPEVQSRLSPLLENVNSSYPTFHHSAMHYYKSFYQIHDTTQSAQVLSTASVKLPLTAFLKGWADLERIIEIYADSHPPPHAKEISLKFGAIKSSLEIILQTNANRKFPNPGLGKSVLSIQSLCDSITNAVYELFMQERFPNFDIDSLKMYKEDVKSFLRVVTDAFYNEFPQSGVALCDLARIKLNVVASCNEIIEALKAAFVFPNSLKSVKNLKDKYNKEMRIIFETLHQPFNVVKPKPENGEGEVFLPPPIQKTKEEETLERIREDDVESRLKNMEPSRKVELFLHDALPLIGSRLNDFSDPWEGLFYLDHKMKELVKNFYINEENVLKLKQAIKTLKEDVKDAKEFGDKKDIVAAEIAANHKIEIDKMQREIDELKFRITQLKNVINEKQEEIENITKTDEIGTLRNGLEKIASIVNKQLNEPLDQKEFPDLKHSDLIDLVISMESNVYDEQRAFIPEYIKNDPNDIGGAPSENNKNGSPLLPMMFETQPKGELKVDSESNQSNEGSPNHLFSRSVSNSNLAMARRVDENERTKEELASSREGHFADLRYIISKMNDFIIGQNIMNSEHAAVFNRNIDNDPMNTRLELIALINDQFDAISKLIKALLLNDKENVDEVRNTKIELQKYQYGLNEALGGNISSLPEDNGRLLEMALNIIINKQNPLHDKILLLSEELRKRDSQELTILTRIAAICKQTPKLPEDEVHDGDEAASPEDNSPADQLNDKLYYNITKKNVFTQIFKFLGIVQDQKDEQLETQKELENSLNSMKKGLYDIELSLRNSIKDKNETKSQIPQPCGGKDELIEKIKKYCDIVVSPLFSDEFVKTPDLDKMFLLIPHDENKHPREYIPQICDRYIKMKAIIDSTKPYLVILDDIFQGIDGKSNGTYEINSQQVDLMQTQVTRLHQTISSANGTTTDSSVSQLISRFISLVQTLLNRTEC